MHLSFRIAERRDTDTLQDLWVQAHNLHLGQHYLKSMDKKFVEKHKKQFGAFFNGQMEDGEIFIGYKGKCPVGYTWLSLCSENPDTAHLTEIFAVKKGVGDPTLKKAERHAIENGRSIIQLESYIESTGFYEKMGYEPQEGEVQRPGLIRYAKKIGGAPSNR